MKIQYMSDLHMEFQENSRYLKNNELPVTGDVLVLAGDKTQAASAEQDLEAASGLPEAIGEEAVAVSKLKEELEEIDAENSASSEAVPEEMPESEAAASEESASAESTARIESLEGDIDKLCAQEQELRTQVSTLRGENDRLTHCLLYTSPSPRDTR